MGRLPILPEAGHPLRHIGMTGSRGGLRIGLTPAPLVIYQKCLFWSARANWAWPGEVMKAASRQVAPLELQLSEQQGDP